MAGLQIKSISQLDELDTSQLGYTLNDSIDIREKFNIDDYTFSIISCIPSTIDHALSIETSDGSKSYGMDLARVINPIVSAILYLYIKQNDQLTRQEAALSFIPWNLAGNDNFVHNGALSFDTYDNDSTDTAIVVKNKNVRFVDNYNNAVFEVRNDGKTIISELSATALTAGSDALFAQNTIVSSPALSATHLSAGYLSAGLTSTTNDFNYFILSVDNTSATVLDLSACNLSAAGMLSAQKGEAAVQYSYLSGTFLSAVNFTATSATDTTINVTNLFGANVSASSLTADSLCAGNKPKTDSNNEIINEYMLSAKAGQTDKNDAKLIAKEILVDSKLCVDDTIYAKNLYAGTNEKLNDITTIYALSAILDGTAFFNYLSGTHLLVGGDGGTNLEVNGNDIIKVAKLSATNLSGYELVGGNTNLSVPATGTINIAQLSAQNLTAGIGPTDGDTGGNLVVPRTGTIKIASLSAQNLTAGIGDRGQGNLVVPATGTITIDSLHAIKLSADGSDAATGIAQLTAKAACWS